MSLKNIKQFTGYLGTFVLLILLLTACSERNKPPFFTVSVTDVYKKELVIDNFTIHYWWEERGETPFLKPHSYHAKELIVEKMVPIGKDTSRVDIKTVRIPFPELDSITFELTDTGKRMLVKPKNGKVFDATLNFPKILKKDKKAGLADQTIFIEGLNRNKNTPQEYSFELNRIKKIVFLGQKDKL